MEYGKKYTQKFAFVMMLVMVFAVLSCLGLWLLFESVFAGDQLLRLSAWSLSSVIIIGLSVRLLVSMSYKPLRVLSDAIVFTGHTSRGGTPPSTDSLFLGREMVSALALQVYDLASMSAQSKHITTATDSVSLTDNLASVFDKLPMPVIGIDNAQTITLANKAAQDYIAAEDGNLLGAALYDKLHLTFQDDNTFEAWLTDRQKNSFKDSKVWQQVRTVRPDGTAIKQFDLIANYNKGSSDTTETFLVLYDRTDSYMRDDQEINFVALAVHELRTPLTIMKGYIEVFEDEVGPTLNDELKGFMHKMQASAQQLTAFVGNILNVARIEENQLSLKLQAHDWADILHTAVEDLSLRARVHALMIDVNIEDNLPPVAVDRISIHEVINNLVDNAIKYAGNSHKIVITAKMNTEGLVETSIQDFGIGIPAAVMPDLFQKFYRSHKSRVQIGGTGLGLYLCKAIVSAHDGNIWVHSKEGEGSVFSFTIQPYDHLKHEQTDGENGIMRGAHGWIKNHSMNRQ